MSKLIDVKRLEAYCLADVPTDLDSGFVYDEDNDYWFKDNDADILAVVHFDTVATPDQILFGTTFDEDKQSFVVNSIQLDDRLGLYIINDLLPSRGVKANILVTTDEEIGRSTAANYDNPENIDYKWGFSFDRRGVLPVLYGYEKQEEWKKAVEKHSEIATGSSSDISKLYKLGKCFVNWGTGYHGEHSSDCYAYFSDIETCVDTFVSFYQENKDKTFEF